MLLFVVGAGIAWGFQSYLLRPGKSDFGLQQKDAPINSALNLAPMAIWTEQNGEVSWQNALFDDIFRGQKSKGSQAFQGSPDALKSGASARMRLRRTKSLRAAEFTVTKSCLAGVDFYYASDATALIEAEQELQRFIQTLTQTFAHLPIGLAIFDKTRDLSLFNPALSDLLDVPAEWLIRRPSLRNFLDRLHNQGTVPEPKDYQSFRQLLIDLENGSIAGNYLAEWALSSGQVLRVVGRPHLKGGIALLFEDISKAVTVERQYRLELEQLYSAFDSLAQGVAIIDATGELAFANEAFDEMWGRTLSNSASPINAVELSRLLQEKCAPSPVWGDFRDFVLNAVERSQWQAMALMLPSNLVEMTFSPISGGQIFCEFKRCTASKRSAAKAIVNNA